MAKKAKTKEQQHFFDKKENITLVLRIFYTLCALLLVLDLIIHRHIYHDWEKLPGFYPLFGFAAYVSLVAVAAGLRKLVMRPEDYYENDGERKK